MRRGTQSRLWRPLRRYLRFGFTWVASACVTLPLLWFLAPGVHPWAFYAGFVGLVYLGGDVLRFGLKERVKA